MKKRINSIFESNNYPTIMFLAIMLVSIILLFNFVSFVEEIDNGITAYAIKENNATPEIKEETKPIVTEDKLEGEVYTTFSWGIFYIIIIIIILLLAVLSITLKNTIKTNITEEDRLGVFSK
jgi:hypothetical protein